MPKQEIVTVGCAAPNPNLSAATRFGNLVFVAGQTGRQGAGGGIAEGAQRREQRWQQGVDPRMGFALDHAEQTPVHHLEGVGLAGDQDDQRRIIPERKRDTLN